MHRGKYSFYGKELWGDEKVPNERAHSLGTFCIRPPHCEIPLKLRRAADPYLHVLEDIEKYSWQLSFLYFREFGNSEWLKFKLCLENHSSKYRDLHISRRNILNEVTISYAVVHENFGNMPFFFFKIIIEA